MPALIPLLAIVALIVTIVAAAGHKFAPLWVAVLLLCIITLLQTWK